MQIIPYFLILFMFRFLVCLDIRITVLVIPIADKATFDKVIYLPICVTLVFPSTFPLDGI